jgi:hypothetical protein
MQVRKSLDCFESLNYHTLAFLDWELYDEDVVENADQDTDPDSSEHGKVQKPFNFYKLSSIECDFNNG